MHTESPLVSIVITAKDRPGELSETLRLLGGQTYANVELLVIDDGSSEPLEPHVMAAWPLARVIRHATSIGLIASRSEAQLLVRGKFLCSLDDDSCFTEATDLQRAVDILEDHPQIGVLTCRTHNAKICAERSTGDSSLYFSGTFAGCAHIMRVDMMLRVGGYYDPFFYYYEEVEYTARVIDSGFDVVYAPGILVHHRISPIGRNEKRIFAYNFRNVMWMTFLRFSGLTFWIEFAWRLFSYTIEAIRSFAPKEYVWAIWSTLVYSRRLAGDRRPLLSSTQRKVVSLRLKQGRYPADRPSTSWPTLYEVRQWLFGIWIHRRRGPAFWSSGKRAVGRSSRSGYDVS